MAIDSRDKRSSAIASRRLPWMRRFAAPQADGAAHSQGDRQQIAFVYRGIDAGEPVSIDPVVVFTRSELVYTCTATATL